MITIISASNRESNLTSLFSKQCRLFLEKEKRACQLFFLDEIPDNISLKSVYNHQDSIFSELGKKLIVPAEKLLFIVPEYNGSVPGILKLFIDGINPSFFYHKKAALIGVSSGRAGNLRGMDHLTDILNHLQVHVMPQKLPISKMNDLLNKGELEDESTLEEIKKQMERLIEF